MLCCGLVGLKRKLVISKIVLSVFLLDFILRQTFVHGSTSSKSIWEQISVSIYSCSFPDVWVRYMSSGGPSLIGPTGSFWLRGVVGVVSVYFISDFPKYYCLVDSSFNCVRSQYWTNSKVGGLTWSSNIVKDCEVSYRE